MDITFKHSIKKSRLVSGATLLQIIIPNLPVSLVAFGFRAGSRFDPASKEGLAHLFEHLLVNQTAEAKKNLDRLKILESQGIVANAETDYETAFYYHIQPAAKTIDSLRLLCSEIFESKIDSTSLFQERKVVLHEERQNYNDPGAYIWRFSNQSLWPKSSLGKDLYGNQKTLKNISLVDVAAFRKRHYLRKHFVCVIVESNLSTAPLAILKAYGGSKKKVLREKFHQPLSIAWNQQKTDQVTVSLAFRGPALGNNQEVAAFNLLRDYLANHWTSRLVTQLRLNHQLTYWVDGLTANFSDTGLLRLVFSCSPQDLDFALQVLGREIALLKTELISVADLVLVKNYHLSALLRDMTQPYYLAWWYAWQEILLGKSLTLNNYVARVKKITSLDIQKTAKNYFVRNNSSLSLIGQIKKKISIDF